MASTTQVEEQRRPKTFVLCFDGTGNKFSGTDADSNILKIYRMLDRTQGDQFHYYQPGIGTYVTSGGLDHTGLTTRIRSWYAKAKDSAVGTSFAHHVMGGYKFLMRYYAPGDDIYLFGFSRGAYTARFLSEMLDWVGLLNSGNEELARFAWKTFSKWQSRRGGSAPEDKTAEKELFEFMTNFRETFSRPVKRIRFLGLFDTVNSVPRFENAWMQRSKFPYSARSSAKVIRHAVAINERRAKFRQDLIAAAKLSQEEHHRHFWRYYTFPMGEQKAEGGVQGTTDGAPDQSIQTEKVVEQPFAPHESRTDRNESLVPDIVVQAASPSLTPGRPPMGPRISSGGLAGPVISPSLENMRGRNLSTTGPLATKSTENLGHARDTSQGSHMSRRAAQHRRRKSKDRKQDIEEVWFPGCHADIGGGWPRAEGEEWPLSHAPLVWMVREAEKAGLAFDPYKMSKLNCCADDVHEYDDDESELEEIIQARQNEKLHKYEGAMHLSGTKGLIHDCLEYGGGLPASSVLSWKIMEWLPFRRMDLRPDGSWEPIRWPLPRGETRDMPETAVIHRSAIVRMQDDKTYRPGNLIVGGGGRGMKDAPEEYGTGEWKIWANEGDPIMETYIRARPLPETLKI